MNRARFPSLSAAALPTLMMTAPAWAASEPFVERLEASLKDRKGVVVYLKGQVFPGRVTRLTADAVELTSLEYARIILRRDALDGVAGN